MTQRNTRYFWLSMRQMRRIQPFFPKVRGRARSDDCKVLSGIIYVKRYGLRWQDAPAVYGPTRPCTTGSPAGPGWASSPGYFRNWRGQALKVIR